MLSLTAAVRILGQLKPQPARLSADGVQMLAEHRARNRIDGQVPVLMRLGVLPHPLAADHDVVVRQMKDAVLQIDIADLQRA